MSSSPLDRQVERIGLRHFTAAVPRLVALDERQLAGDLEREARAFCAALSAHRRSRDYRDHLRDGQAAPCDGLVAQLLAAADVLRQDGDVAGLGAWCCTLAGRLGVHLEVLDPAFTETLVLIDLDGASLGELVLVPYDPPSRSGE